jgi:hypothetical protein
MGFTISKSAITFTPDDKTTRKYEALPEGDYDVVVTEANIASDEKGDRIEVQYTVDDAKSQYNRRLLFDTIYFVARGNTKAGAVKAGMGKIGDIINAGSLDVTDDDDEIDVSLLSQKMIGLQAVARVTQREWDGKVYNNIKGLKKPGEAPKVLKVSATKKGF